MWQAAVLPLSHGASGQQSHRGGALGSPSPPFWEGHQGEDGQQRGGGALAFGQILENHLQSEDATFSLARPGPECLSSPPGGFLASG